VSCIRIGERVGHKGVSFGESQCPRVGLRSCFVLAGGKESAFTLCLARLFAFGKVCASPIDTRVADSRCHANGAGLFLRVVGIGHTKSVVDFLTFTWT
jgi:hypothetical protein